MTIRHESGSELEAALPPEPEQPKSKLVDLIPRLRTTFMSVLWLAIGVLVIGYAALLIHTNFVRVEVDSAVVAGHVEPVSSPITGMVADLTLKPGDRFEAGDIIYRIRDADADQAIALASLKVERARDLIVQREAEHKAQIARRDDALLAARAEIARLDTDVAALQEQEEIASRRVTDYTELFRKGITTRMRLEDLVNRQIDLRHQILRTTLRRKERTELLELAMSGRSSEGNEVIVRLAEAEAELLRARQELERCVEELKIRMERRQANTVVAQSGGRVLRILRRSNARIMQGDVILVFERDQDRHVHAFLTQDQLSRIEIGTTARLYVAATRQIASAKVTRVERSGAYLDDIETRYLWRAARDPGVRHTDRDRTGRVTLAFLPQDRAAAEAMEIGTPVVVSFERVGSMAPGRALPFSKPVGK